MVPLLTALATTPVIAFDGDDNVFIVFGDDAIVFIVSSV
jgi:hypothetical protein